MKTKVSAIFLGKKLFKVYASECLKQGKTEKEIIKGWTLEKLNKMSEEFCKKYNFELK